jgi:Mrp family chromosome partitioning ATPase/capsular polysaccharide biosynthesis protein
MTEHGLKEYLQVLRRRKWIVLQAVIIVPLAATLLALRQSPQYQASADVLLRYQTLPSSISGLTDPSSFSYYIDPTRSTSTQIELARLPQLASRVAAALPHSGLTAGQILGSSGVSSVTDTDLLRFTVTEAKPELAARIATEYARQFTLYRKQLDTGSITSSLRDLQSRIQALRGSGGSRLAITQLVAKEQQLQTLLSLETANAVVVRVADGAAKVRPTPRKYALLGLGLGILLGVGLAFLREAFDTKLRSAEAIGTELHLPLLGRVPPPPRQLQKRNELVMLDSPTSPAAEAFRMLRTNLEFVTLGKPAGVIMVTSALEQEGKSTTVANLAVALAGQRKHVTLVDLDLRRPMVERLFKISADRPGITDVVLGYAVLDEALARVPHREFAVAANGAVDRRSLGLDEIAASNGNHAEDGLLEVLACGRIPPVPGEFIGLDSVRHIIAALRERSDVVLVDTPPALKVGDAMTIAGFSDAVLVVVRAETARRPAVAELARVLEGWPTQRLGFVLCGADSYERYAYYGYGGAYSSEQRPRERVS